MCIACSKDAKFLGSHLSRDEADSSIKPRDKMVSMRVVPLEPWQSMISMRGYAEGRLTQPHHSLVNISTRSFCSLWIFFALFLLML